MDDIKGRGACELVEIMKHDLQMKLERCLDDVINRKHLSDMEQALWFRMLFDVDNAIGDTMTEAVINKLKT